MQPFPRVAFTFIHINTWIFRVRLSNERRAEEDYFRKEAEALSLEKYGDKRVAARDVFH